MPDPTRKEPATPPPAEPAWDFPSLAWIHAAREEIAREAGGWPKPDAAPPSLEEFRASLRQVAGRHAHASPRHR